MKSLLRLFKKQKIRTTLKDVGFRFPLALIMSWAITLLFFIVIATNPDTSTMNVIWKYIFTFIIVFFLSLWVSLLWESWEKKSKNRYFYQAWTVVFWMLFFYFLPSSIGSFESIVFFTLTLFWIIASLFIAPYIKHLHKWSFEEQWYYVYFYRISVVFFFSFIVWGALTLLWNIAILTVTTLFDIWYIIGGDIHGYWTVIVLTFLTPYFALSQIPKKGSFEDKYFNENAFFHFLIRYIALPFIYVYFIILYAYTLKVLINFWNWPKGEVSWMVIGFSVFGYLIYIFSYIFEQWKNTESYRFIVLFRKYFPLVVIPQIWMLFYAIFLRIGQYDITVNRYFIVVFWLWLLVTSLYLILSSKKSLLLIPTFLTFFTLIISLGPWSVYNLPLERQTERLKYKLTQANILQNWVIIPLKNPKDISEDLSSQIYDGIDYLCDFDNCNAIKDIFPKLYNQLLIKDKNDFNTNSWAYTYKAGTDDGAEYREPGKWEIKRYITDTIKVQYYYPGSNAAENIYYINTNSPSFPIEISWYDYILQINSYWENSGDISANINWELLEMNITLWDISESTSIENIFTALRTHYEENNESDLSKSENIFDIETLSFTGKLIVENATLFADANYNDSDENAKQYMWWILLLKVK